MKLSVIVPAFNEEAYLPATLGIRFGPPRRNSEALRTAAEALDVRPGVPWTPGRRIPR